MPDQQKLEKFWTKLTKASMEIQHDFSELDPQDKQIVKERLNNILKMRGITVGIDSLLSSWMERYRAGVY